MKLGPLTEAELVEQRRSEHTAREQQVWLWSYRVGHVLWRLLLIGLIAGLAWWLTR